MNTPIIEVPSQIAHDRGVLEQEIKTLLDDFLAKYNYSFTVGSIGFVTSIEKTKVGPIYGSSVKIKLEI